MKNSIALGALCLCLSPAVAQAGWSVTQEHTSKSGSRVTELSYDHHMLRVDAPKSRDPSIVIDLKTGDFTMIDHEQKRYAKASLQELMAMRDQIKEQMKEQMKKMPPQMQAQIQKMIDEQEAAAKKDLVVVNTKKTDKVMGHSCTYYTWKAPDGAGKACITSKAKIDTKQFRKDAIALGEKLKKEGAGPGATSVELLQLAKHGFPLKTIRTMEMGPQKVETTATVTKMSTKKHPKTLFAAPVKYKKIPFRQMAEAPLSGAKK